MSGLLEKFAAKASTRRQTAAETYLELLDRADAPKAGDEERLAACLSELGLSPQDVEQHLRARAGVVRLQEQLKTEEQIAELDRKAAATRKAVQTYIRDTLKQLIDQLGVQQLDWAINALGVATGYSATSDKELMAMHSQATSSELSAINTANASAEARRKIAELKSANAVAFSEE